MATDTDQAAEVADDTPAPSGTGEGQVIEARDDDDTAAPEPEPTAEAEPAEEPEKPVRSPAWVKPRIDKLTFEKHEAQREAQELRDRLAAYEAPAAPAAEEQTERPTLTEADIEKRARALAGQMAADHTRAAEFNKACDDTYDRGKAAFTDFDAVVSELAMHSGLGMQQDGRSPFLDAVIQIPDGEKVLYHLGQNPDEAAKIMALPPVAMAINLARMSAEIGKPKPRPVSGAPAPISPVEGGGNAGPIDLADDNLSEPEWHRQREAQRAKRQQ